jgi:hypothetical protein
MYPNEHSPAPSESTESLRIWLEDFGDLSSQDVSLRATLSRGSVGNNSISTLVQHPSADINGQTDYDYVTGKFGVSPLLFTQQEAPGTPVFYEVDTDKWRADTEGLRSADDSVGTFLEANEVAQYVYGMQEGEGEGDGIGGEQSWTFEPGSKRKR